MVRRTITTIYEDGVFRPLTAIDNAVSEGQTVQITVEAPETPDELLAMAKDVFKGLSEEEIDAIERIALDRDGFFGDNVS